MTVGLAWLFQVRSDVFMGIRIFEKNCTHYASTHRTKRGQIFFRQQVHEYRFMRTPNCSPFKLGKSADLLHVDAFPWSGQDKYSLTLGRHFLRKEQGKSLTA